MVSCWLPHTPAQLPTDHVCISCAAAPTECTCLPAAQVPGVVAGPGAGAEHADGAGGHGPRDARIPAARRRRLRRHDPHRVRPNLKPLSDTSMNRMQEHDSQRGSLVFVHMLNLGPLQTESGGCFAFSCMKMCISCHVQVGQQDGHPRHSAGRDPLPGAAVPGRDLHAHGRHRWHRPQPLHRCAPTL
jgi:hypothetical protein